MSKTRKVEFRIPKDIAGGGLNRTTQPFGSEKDYSRKRKKSYGANYCPKCYESLLDSCTCDDDDSYDQASK